MPRGARTGRRPAAAGGDLVAVRRFEEEVLQTQVRLYEEWLAGR